VTKSNDNLEIFPCVSQQIDNEVNTTIYTK